MQHWDPDPKTFHIIPVKPGLEARCRRTNLAIILILAALVVGSFVGVITPRASNSTVHHAPAKIHPTPAAHAS